jgi:hypothetical protein
VACDPDDNAGCDDPAMPFCDAGNFECRACNDDAECDGGQCVDGDGCQPCDPSDDSGCDDPGLPACRADFVCVECEDDEDCPLPGATCNVMTNTCEGGGAE